MRSRNLFLKSNATQRAGWVLLALLGVGSVVVLLMHPKEIKRDDWAWQSPIEPPGVTIVSQEPQALLVPASMPSVSDAQSRAQPTPFVEKSAQVVKNVVNPAPTAMRLDDRAQIRQVLERWSQAWSSRSMDAYFDQYATSFVPAGGLSRSAWEKVRRQRILSKGQITHEIRDLQVTLDGEMATVKFEQLYATAQTHWVGPKILRLQREGVRWRIISESAN
ncbi:hypothetical protein B9Z52_06085 [Limnohabitans sp. Jir72]|nr:hypothetical protein B9Z52_06085 [Limnohabitans sp. Jir72]